MTPFTAEAWPTPTHALVGDRTWCMFSGCNYLGLSHEPQVLAALQAGLQQYGVAANGSPITTGKTTAHEQLEHELAQFWNCEAALLTVDGALANLAVCQALAAGHDFALLDERAHPSLLSAARAAGLRIEKFPHLDASHAVQVCRLAAGRVLLLTDGVFSTSGEQAGLVSLLEGLPASATLLVDDCHGFAVLGPHGEGALAQAKAESLAAQQARCTQVITTSLSKGLGCFGGAIGGDAAVVRQIATTAAAYRTSTPFPAALAAAGRAALRRLRQDSTLLGGLRRNLEQFRTGWLRLGLPLPKPAVPIYCFVPQHPEQQQRFETELAARSLGVPLLDYPGGPAPQYYRIAICAGHSAPEIEQLLQALTLALAS